MSKNTLIILGHGKTESLGHSLLQECSTQLKAQGAKVRVHSLLEDGFDPVLRLESGEEHAGICCPKKDPLTYQYQQDAIWADHFVVIHPVWWFAPPAILKGWIDRVFVDGVAVHQPKPGQSASKPVGIMGSKNLLLVQCYNAQATIDRVVFGGISRLFWKRAVCLATGMSMLRVALYDLGKAHDLDLHKLLKKKLEKLLN